METTKTIKSGMPLKDIPAARKIEILRALGWKIKVQHMRPLVGQEDLPYEIGSFWRKHELVRGEEFSSKGGWTHVKITNPDNGLSCNGLAFCSPKDNFSKKIGLNIALGRALKEIDRLY